jgi:beta-galactosidase
MYHMRRGPSLPVVKTTGVPAAIRLRADRSIIKADRNDLSYIMADIIDSEGNVVPYADDISVNFEISGNGKLAGVGSGNPSDMSGFQQPVKKSYQGRCLLIVRPDLTPGKISVRASADGLRPGTAEIETR